MKPSPGCKWFLLVLLLTFTEHVQASPACAATIDELRGIMGDQAFPLRWEETSMDDGKPLMVSIVEKNGGLFLEFIKTREGLWAESAGVVCKIGAEIETRFTAEQIRLGPAASWLLRQALGGGGKFILTRIGPDQLRIATSGWNGDFSSVSK